MQSSQAHISQVYKLFDNIFCSVITTAGPSLHFNNESFWLVLQVERELWVQDTMRASKDESEFYVTNYNY